MRTISTLLLGLALATGTQSLYAGDAKVYTAVGKASYYGQPHHGKPTANGEAFNKYQMTAAHRTLPFGTRVRVTNLKNGKSVIVRINDRGPFTKGRIIDVSKEAAAKLDMVRDGVASVRVEQLKNAR